MEQIRILLLFKLILLLLLYCRINEVIENDYNRKLAAGSVKQGGIVVWGVVELAQSGKV